MSFMYVCLIIKADKNKSLEQYFNSHILAKGLARTENTGDKAIAENSNAEVICANFDLQKVLLVPADPTNNKLFSKSKVTTNNFIQSCEPPGRLLHVI